MTRESTLLYKEEYNSEKFSMQGSLDEEYHIDVRFQGKGTSEGTLAFITMLSKMYEEIPDNKMASAILDCSDYGKTPIRTQFSIGRWLLKNRAKTGLVAVVGAQRWEENIGKAIIKITGIKSISFFREKQAALDWMQRNVKGRGG